MTAFFKYFSRAAAIAPLALALASSASAQAPYPNRNITLVLPFAAGSGTDTTTRIISKELGTALGVGMVIDNKAGANGSIAASYVARSAPDGYTLFVTTNTTHSANPYLLKTMSYDPMKAFTPIARTGDLPFMLVINPEIPANSVAELIALAKKEPGKYSYASGSSSAIVSGATFARLAGIDLLHVPYKSSPPALTDVIAGRVSMMFVDVLTGLPHVKGKALKMLAVTTKQKSALLPELPTMDETVKGFDITSWQGYLGPANMPKDMVVKLNTEIRKIVERPEIKEQLAERQSAGRGRRGRPWVSPFAENLYYSLVLRIDGGMRQLEGLSLVVGLAVMRTLQAFGLKDVGLKWPNDVLADGRKITGILLELVGDPADVCHVVLGIGINVNMQGNEQIDQQWASMRGEAGQRLRGAVPRHAGRNG
ncbi:MAG: biotin--[acetyl-CoA-carboxylase] ligase, partial [Bradyrhizobium icense]